jgi:acyl-CoA synthetase (AMP-forming)/AMP-acid ligase II
MESAISGRLVVSDDAESLVQLTCSLQGVERPDVVVTARAQQPSDVSGQVAMVNCDLGAPSAVFTLLHDHEWLAAESAGPILFSPQAKVPVDGQGVSGEGHRVGRRYVHTCKGSIVLTHFKIPRRYKFVDEFPMTVTGKVQKFRMREIAVEELGLQQAAGVQTA